MNRTTRTNAVGRQGVHAADDRSRPSVYDPTAILIGRRLNGEEVWATIKVADEQLLRDHVGANGRREPGVDGPASRHDVARDHRCGVRRALCGC